jgi:hypothetical protein
MRLLTRAVAVTAAAFALLAASIAPASSSEVEYVGGHVTNGTPYGMYIAEFGEGSSSCYIWNSGGSSAYSPTTWSCDRRSLSPGSSSPWYLDVDGFTVPFIDGYWVNFQYNGTWRWVDNGNTGATFTRIRSWHGVRCYEDGWDYEIECIVSG